MFEDSLLDYAGRGKTRKPWTVAFSFVIQSLVTGIMVLVPLLYTEALPKHQLMTFLMAPPPPPPPPPPPALAPKVRIMPKVMQQPQEMVQPRRRGVWAAVRIWLPRTRRMPIRLQA